jgi:hypothetical protein
MVYSNPQLLLNWQHLLLEGWGLNYIFQLLTWISKLCKCAEISAKTTLKLLTVMSRSRFHALPQNRQQRVDDIQLLAVRKMDSPITKSRDISPAPLGGAVKPEKNAGLIMAVRIPSYVRVLL